MRTPLHEIKKIVQLTKYQKASAWLLMRWGHEKVRLRQEHIEYQDRYRHNWYGYNIYSYRSREYREWFHAGCPEPDYDKIEVVE